MFRRTLVCAALATALMANSAGAQQSPPNAEEAKRIEALVNKAAALVEKQGSALFPEFRKRGSEWFSGDTYLFAYDDKLKVLLQPAVPAREGTSPGEEKDVNGKHFHQELQRVAQTQGSGWVDYMLPRPGQTRPSHKWSYVKAVPIDGTPGFIGAGFYTD